MLFKTIIRSSTFAVLLSVIGISFVGVRLNAQPRERYLESFDNDYYSGLFRWDPNLATYAGIHDYDAKLSDLSAECVAKRVKELNQFKKRIIELWGREDESLPLPVREERRKVDEVDNQILLHSICAELIDLEYVRDWQRNPVPYLSKPA